MRPDLNCHIPEEMLDEMALGRLAEPASEVWEEHLLVCAACQDRLAQADEYMRAMKSAAKSLRDDSSPAQERFPARKPMMVAVTHAMFLAVLLWRR